MKPTRNIIGILLAAGIGVRFDPSGKHNKLSQLLLCGDTVAAAAAKAMLDVLPRVIAVVRANADPFAVQLGRLGCEVTVCPDADQGMGASLVHALNQGSEEAAWVIGLADMPYVQAATIGALSAAIDQGADIAVPVFQGKRGNPVAFSRFHLMRLLALGGDQGARNLLKTFPVVEVAVDDAGIGQDIDTASDLPARG